MNMHVLLAGAAVAPALRQLRLLAWSSVNARQLGVLEQASANCAVSTPAKQVRLPGWS
jgi:hypothetical protein